MDRKLNNISQRTISGILYLAVIIGSLFIGGVAFAAVLLLAGSIALYEFYMLGSGSQKLSLIIPGIVAGVFSMAASYIFFSGISGPEIISLNVIIILSLFIYALFTKGHDTGKQFLGLLYIIMPLSLAFYLIYPSFTGNSYTHRIILGVFILIWMNDTGAYLTGISAGKHPLYSRISPKKTWEGVIGGTAVTIAVSFFMNDLMHIMGKKDWITIALIVSFFGVAGDLFESMLKRNAEVKDSGNIIPGHGGVLDRFDSMLFVIPAVFVYLVLNNL